MCLIAFDWQPEAKNWLTLTANRDEFWQRPSAPLHKWPDSTGIVAGQDLEQGGTWLGANPHGQFAVLTNIRAPGVGPENPRSRGHLVKDYLAQAQSAAAYAQEILQQCAEFAPFNLLIGNRTQLLWLSNFPEPKLEPVAPGIHSLSNAALDTPWPKARLAQQQLQQWLTDKGSSGEPQQLADLMNSTATFADDELPQTGVPYPWEKMLSAQLITSASYGTRCSSSLTGNDKTLTLCELSRNTEGAITARHCEHIALP